MSRVSDTVARILDNVDGETKVESHSAEEAVEIYQAVVDNLQGRVNRLQPNVDAMREDRERLSQEQADAAAADALRPAVAKARTPRALKLEAAGKAAPDEPGGNAVPVVSQPKNTPATHTDPAPISMGGSDSANDL